MSWYTNNFTLWPLCKNYLRAITIRGWKEFEEIRVWYMYTHVYIVHVYMFCMSTCTCRFVHSTRLYSHACMCVGLTGTVTGRCQERVGRYKVRVLALAQPCSQIPPPIWLKCGMIASYMCMRLTSSYVIQNVNTCVCVHVWLHVGVGCVWCIHMYNVHKWTLVSVSYKAISIPLAIYAKSMLCRSSGSDYVTGIALSQQVITLYCTCGL